MALFSNTLAVEFKLTMESLDLVDILLISFFNLQGCAKKCYPDPSRTTFQSASLRKGLNGVLALSVWIISGSM